MFKIAFPWAKQAEEKVERDYLKSKGDTSHDEIAGNVWISPLLGKSSETPSRVFALTTASLGARKRVSSLRLGQSIAGS